MGCKFDNTALTAKVLMFCIRILCSTKKNIFGITTPPSSWESQLKAECQTMYIMLQKLSVSLPNSYRNTNFLMDF